MGKSSPLGPAISRQMGLGYIRKAERVGGSTMGSKLVSNPWFLLQAPALPSLDGGLKFVHLNPFLSQIAVSHAVNRSNREAN